MKKRIYIVDDQAPVMETAVLVVQSIDPHWEVKGFQEPLQALAAVRDRAPDLILADQLMPGMLGSQLLEQVRAISPTTIRIIMSGYVAPDKLDLLTSAHQYLAKPFDGVTLRETIQRSFAARLWIADQSLQSVATSLRSIPSLPHAHQKLLMQLEDHSNAMANIARLVAEDPGLSAKVIHLANSPLFGRNYMIAHPSDAVMCLGTEIIMAVVLSQSLFRHYELLALKGIDLRQVWSHCWQTATLAHHLCRQMQLSRGAAEVAFLAGLLHETGLFILADNFPEAFQAVCQSALQMKSPLAPKLREAFRSSPAQLTAYVLELWGMPTDVIAAVALLDDPSAGLATGFTPASALYIADGVVSRQSLSAAFVPEEWNISYLKAIGCLENLPAWQKLSLGS